MSTAAENKNLVLAFWRDLYETRDYDRCGAYFSEDGLYRDVPAPDSGARGPKAIAKRLKIGLEVIDNHVHHLHRIVAEDDTVVTEHTEDWHFKTGEVVKLPFVSVMAFDNGKIVSWSDYWDMNTLMGGAPQWWLDRLTKYSEEDFYNDSSTAG